ncbi:bifunctional protein-serine/threonine kinase/phosphatase [Pseudomonas aeruginosa]|uniref:bifunctional protein-serine/threonine kinase/phosphatase n=1 Tax=Pseudomonas aeruginosa TaxID=287 RepID=UPI001FB6B56D|nr:bifunctional protein-serine/threonine kinase/phosphatase [Pseudomonas aeruginosa]
MVTPAPALAASKGHLLAIADGVSQCADGGLAARSSLQALALDYYATPETWAIVQSLDRLLLAQNRWLQANGGGQPLLTTLTALVLRGTRYTLAHVGDCRAYLWRDGELLRQTSDHVWEQPHMQHVLTRALGLDQHLVVDYLEGDLEPGESRQSLLYRVEDGQGQPWLLKTLPAARADDPLATQALLLEEWFLRRVQGRHFPELHGLAQRQHLYYLMREHPGETLAERLRNHGPLSLPEWLGLANQLLRGLGQLHRRNLLHRDLKPENLHLGRDGELRLLDFGLAWCPGLSREDPHLLPGTPSYLAPECFSGTSPSVRQDLYATGVCLYQALTGRYPYGEIEAFQHPRFGRPVPPSRYRPDLPAWIDDLLLRAVACDPAQRFETAEEWLLSLQQGEALPVAAPRPLLEREPLQTWRAIALLSLAANLALLLVWLKG